MSIQPKIVPQKFVSLTCKIGALIQPVNASFPKGKQIKLSSLQAAQRQVAGIWKLKFHLSSRKLGLKGKV